MRTIKFRGLSVNGEWYYGLLSEVKENRKGIQKGFYISNKMGMPFAYQIRPETHGQFIGLTDKNGKEIYEGDVLHVWEHSVDDRGIVRYDKSYTAFVVGKYNCTVGEFEHIEVVGNIYENPELLK